MDILWALTKVGLFCVFGLPVLLVGIAVVAAALGWLALALCGLFRVASDEVLDRAEARRRFKLGYR